MSLTHLLTQPKIRALFDAALGRPDLSIGASRHVPCRAGSRARSPRRIEDPDCPLLAEAV